MLAPPRRERIVYTRHDGGVSICCPSSNCMRWMSLGGRWNDQPRGFVDVQIERQIAAGCHERAAVRFAHAMMYGGCTDMEALEIIRDRDCGHLGTAFELVDMSEIPTGRWFRNAWRRSHNGGPIWVDMGKARRIQLERIRAAVDAHNRPRLVLGRRPYVPLWGEIGNAIRHAKDEHDLECVWPAKIRRAASVAQHSQESTAPKPKAPAAEH